MALILLFLWILNLRRDNSFARNPLLFTYSKVWLSLLVIGVLSISFGYKVYFIRIGYESVIDKVLLLAISSVAFSFLIKKDKIKRGHWNPDLDKYLIILIFLFIFVIIYITSASERIPFLFLFSGEETLMSARYQSKFNFNGNVYVKNLFFGKLIKFTALVAYANYLLRPNRLRSRIAKILIVFAAYAELFDGEKAPFVFLLISLAMIRLLIRGLNIKSLIRPGAVAFVAMFSFYLIIGEGSTFDLLESMFNRALVVPVAGLFLTLNYFPDRIEFLHGASLPQWMIAPFDLEHMRGARAVMEQFNPDGVEQGTAGVVNSWYQAEAFANFGFATALISPLIIIPFLFVIRSALSSYARSVQIGLIAFLLFEIPYFGGFVECFWNVKIMFILAISYFLSLRIVE